MSWTTPQQYQLWSQRPPPMGWVGPWPPPPGSGPWPPGFPGPPPNNTAVPQNTWTDGQWMFNPQFAGFPASGGPTTAQPWAPWQWGQQQQQQQQQSYNPYKRVPKPADESYWKTELKDNGLGLEGMDANEKPPSTPWAWVPRNLRELSNGQDAPERETAAAPQTQSRSQPHRSDGRSSHVQDQNYPTSTAERPHRSSTSTPRHDSYSRTSSRRPSLDRAGTTNDRSESRAREDNRKTESSTSSRRTGTRESTTAPISSSATTPTHSTPTWREPGSTVLQSTSAPARADGYRESSRSSADPSRSKSSYRSPSPSPARHYSSSRQNTYDPPTATHASVPRTNVVPRAPARRPETGSSSYRSREPVSASAAAAAPTTKESFTQQRELHTTFSTGVVRTPDHYNPVTSPPPVPTRRNSEDRSQPPSTSASSRSRVQDTPSSRAPIRPPSRSQTHPYTAPPMMHASSSGSSTEIVVPPRPAGLTPPRPSSVRPGQQPVTRHNSMPMPIKTVQPPPMPMLKPEPEAPVPTLAALTHFSDASGDNLLSPLIETKPTPTASPPPQRPQAAQTIPSSLVSSASRQAGGVTHNTTSQKNARAMSRSRTYPTVPSGPMYDPPDVITPSVSASASVSTRPSPQYQSVSAPRSPYEPTSASSTAPVTPTSGISPSRRYPPFGASQYPQASSTQPSPSKDPYAPAPVSTRVSSTGTVRPLARHQTYDSAQLEQRPAATVTSPTSRHESYGSLQTSSRTIGSSSRAPTRQPVLESSKYESRPGVPNGSSQPSPNGQVAYDAYGRPIEPAPSPAARGPVTRHQTYDATQYDSSPSSDAMPPPPSRGGVYGSSRNETSDSKYSSSRGATSASTQAYQSSSRQASAPVSASSSRSTSRTRTSYDGTAPPPLPAAVPSPYKYSSRDRRGPSEEPIVVPPKPAVNELGEITSPTSGYQYSSRGRRGVTEEPAVIPPIPARQYESPVANGISSASGSNRVQSQRERDRSREQSIFVPPKPDDIWGNEEVKSPPVSASRTHQRRESKTQHEIPGSSSRETRESSSAARASSRAYGYEPSRRSDERPSHTSSASASYSRNDSRGSSSASKTATSPYTHESRSSSAATARPSVPQTYTANHEIETSSATPRDTPASSPYNSRQTSSQITSSSSPYGAYTSRTSSTRPSPSSHAATTMARSSSQGQSPMSYSSQSHHRSASNTVPQTSMTNGHSPSGYSNRSGGSSSSSRQTHSSSGSQNPLPPPPQPVSIPRTPHTPHTVSASSSAQAHGDGSRRQIRRGFWNRRGDHLTADLQVVYAPAHRANPPDLHMYPSPTEGYLDHQGVFLQYDPNRPELKDSLPRHGRPAMRPYDSFVQIIAV